MTGGNNTSQCSIVANPEDCIRLMSVHISMAILSLLACIYIMLLMWHVRSKQNETEKRKCSTELLIQHLAFAVLLTSIHYAVDNYHLAYLAKHGPWPWMVPCRLFGWLDQFSSWVTNLWVLEFTWLICKQAMESREPPEKKIVWKLWKWNVIISLVFSILPFLLNAYGPAGIWCWIRIDGKHFIPGVVLQTFLYYGSSMVIYLVVIGLLLASCCIDCKKKKMGQTVQADEEAADGGIKSNTLFLLPVIFMICFVCAAINRIRLATHHDFSEVANVIFWLLIAFFPPSSGWMFAFGVTIAYGKELKCYRKGTGERTNLVDKS